MRQNNKIILQVFNVVLCVAIIVFTALMMKSWSALVQAVFHAVASLGQIAEVLYLIFRKESFIKLTCIAESLAAIMLTTFILLGTFAHLNDYPTDAEKIDAVIGLVRSTGSWGMVVYVLIQILQVVILPLPAIVCYVPGAVIWSPLVATLLASLGVIIGSLICYFLGKQFGRKALIWIAGKDAT